MDSSALFNLSYGMYVVTTKDSDRNVGCVANSAIQVASSPATLALSLNKNNHTTSCIKDHKRFAISILSEKAPESLIGTFGFSSSKEKDKFDGIEYTLTDSGLPVLKGGVCAFVECELLKQLDCDTHILLIASIKDAGSLSKEPPMTYDYYHKVIKGKAPKNAPTYVDEKPGVADGGKSYTCDICQYVYPGTAEEFESLPDSYVCPICSAAKPLFILK